MSEFCKVCGAKLEPRDGKMCEVCYERLQEERAEAEANREISKTEEIFGSEEAYYRYKNG